MAFADAVSDSQADLNRSYNEYYKEMKAKPDASPEAAHALSQKLIAPAVKKKHKATLDAIQQSEEESSKKNRSHGGSSSAASGGKSSQPAAMPTHDAIVLDGSKIPAEIDFPGHSARAKPLPKPSPVRY